MQKRLIRCLIVLVFILGFVLSPSAAIASPGLSTVDLSTGLTSEDLVQTLLGSGVEVQNITFIGDNQSAGTFGGGTGIIGFEEGIILSSGFISNVIGPNKSDGITGVLGLPGDPDLNALIPGYSTNDATILEFDFKPEFDNIVFEYVFSSDEYNEWVGSAFNDVFGFFVNGANVALIPGTGTPVSINNVNNGSHPAYYIDNDWGDFSPGPYPVDTEMDGLTVVLSVNANVNPGVWNHIKLAIADAGDDILDSNVFIKAESFVSVPDLYLKPLEATNLIGELHILTANYTMNNIPVPDASIHFEVISGPHVGISGDSVTNELGIATWSYTGTSAGTDNITASTWDEEVQIFSNEVTKTWINNPPLADDKAISTDEDTAKEITLSGSDVETVDLTFAIVTPPSHGTLSIITNIAGTSGTPNTDTANVTYTPDASYNGPDSFTYKVTDDGDGESPPLDSDPATVSITVGAVNDLPVADDKAVSTDEDTAKEITLSGSDVETVDLTFAIVTPPSHGTLSIITNIAGTSGTPNTDTANVTYTPDASYNGPDSFTYKVTDDGDGESPPLDSEVAMVSITVIPVTVNNPPVADIAEIDDDTVPLPVTIKVTPQTLNLERLGKWVKVHVCDDSDNTPQQIVVTLDGSGSYDPDGDPLTYDWTLTGPDGDIPVSDDVISQDIILSDGDYTVTLVVNDGTVDSAPDTESFTLTDMTIDDLTSVDPNEFTLNGVPASEIKGGGSCLVISFDNDAIAATVEVGLDVEMRLEGPVSGVDYIDVIQDKDSGNGKGKSDLKNGDTPPGQNTEPADNGSGKGNGKDTAPGQNKGTVGNTSGQGNGKDTAPGQNKEAVNNTNGKGKGTAPGQNK